MTDALDADIRTLWRYRSNEDSSYGGSNRHGKQRYLTINTSSSEARFLAYLRALRYPAVIGGKALLRIVAPKVTGASRKARSRTSCS
jgi:hypothetical protein